MIQRLIDWFNFSQYERAYDQLRARYIVLVQLIALLGAVSFVIWRPLSAPSESSGVATTAEQPMLLVLFVGMLVLTVSTFLLLHFRHLLAAGISTVASSQLISAGVVLISPEIGFDSLTYIVPLVSNVFVAYLLTNQWGGSAITGLSILMLIADPGAASLQQVVGAVLGLVSAGVVGLLYLRTFDITQLEGLRAASGERSRLAEVIRRLAEVSSEQQPLEPTLAASLRAIQALYPQFQALGVYLVDESGLFAELEKSIGVIRTNAQGRFAVGDVSPVGQATLSGQLQVRTQASIGQSEGAALLPGMQQQVVVPMLFGARLVGALDLQSAQHRDLSREDQEALATIADTLALVVFNARQLEEAQRRAKDNVRLTEQARNALAEVQRLNKRLISRAWADYLKENTALSSVEYDAVTGTIATDAPLTPHLEAALRKGQVQIDDGVLSFPLLARGQVIGAIEVDLPLDAEIDNRYADLLQELGERVGLAIENVRLLEQSQRSAQREALINQISTRIQTTINVEAMLAETARSLNELLLASHVSIRLGKPEAPQAAPNGASKREGTT